MTYTYCFIDMVGAERCERRPIDADNVDAAMAALVSIRHDDGNWNAALLFEDDSYVGIATSGLVDVMTDILVERWRAYPVLSDLDGQAHVLLDALAVMEDAIQHGHLPWEDYDGDREPGNLADPDTYRRLLCAALANATRTLDGSDPTNNYRTALDAAGMEMTL